MDEKLANPTVQRRQLKDFKVNHYDVEGKQALPQIAKISQKENMMFNFNSQELFSPDADSIDVAKQCWKWLLNPIDISNLNGGRATHISRNYPEWYDQIDPEDNLMSEAMIS